MSSFRIVIPLQTMFQYFTAPSWSISCHSIYLHHPIVSSGWDIISATHSVHPLFMCVGYLSFHTTPTALYNGDSVRNHSMCIIIIHCSITQVWMLLHVKFYWHSSCSNACHPHTDNFKSNLTLLLEPRFSIGVKLPILRNATLSNLNDINTN